MRFGQGFEHRYCAGYLQQPTVGGAFVDSHGDPASVPVSAAAQADDGGGGASNLTLSVKRAKRENTSVQWHLGSQSLTQSERVCFIEV